MKQSEILVTNRRERKEENPLSLRLQRQTMRLWLRAGIAFWLYIAEARTRAEIDRHISR